MMDASWGQIDDFPVVFDRVTKAGGEVVLGLFDVIPFLYPAMCAAATVASFTGWFDAVIRHSTQVLCNSRATAIEAADVLRAREHPSKRLISVGWFPLGAEFPQPSIGARVSASTLAACDSPFFLSVGTIEPRKGHLIALSAFDILWDDGFEGAYVIIGRSGWNTQFLQQRIKSHPQFGKRLFWLHDVGDDDLAYAYLKAQALVFSSIAEGFGLPLVEAAHHGTPLILSDIPIFREIAPADATFFVSADARSLAAVILASSTDTLARKISNSGVYDWDKAVGALYEIVCERRYQFSSLELTP